MRQKGSKLAILMIALALLVILCGCQSKEEKQAAEKAKAEASREARDAAAADEMIGALGEITLNDACKQRIDDARATYDALSEAAKAQVTGLDALVLAEKRYGDLVAAREAKKAAEEAQKKLEAARKKQEEEAAAEAEAEAQADSQATKSSSKSKGKKSKRSTPAANPKKIAKSCVGKNINTLFRKIGAPNSKTIETGCHDGGRDMFCNYSGFTVVAHAKKNSNTFIITSVD